LPVVRLVRWGVPMDTTCRPPFLAVLFLLAACGGNPQGSALVTTPPGVTPNGKGGDAGRGTVPVADAGIASSPDAGWATACPLGYLAGADGGCVGPYALLLSAVAVAESGDHVYAGDGMQPTFTARVVDPSLASGDAPILLTLTVAGIAEPSYTFDATNHEVLVDTRTAPQGSYVARAVLALDGGTIVSNTLNLIVDRSPPQLTVTLPGVALDGGALIRDLIAEADLVATDDRAGIADLRLQGSGPSLSYVPGAVTKGTGTAEWPVALTGRDALRMSGRVEVHAADIPFDTGGDQAANVTLLATATDRAGNSAQALLSLPMTRLKWASKSVSGSRDGMVLGRTGRIYGALAFDVWGLDPSGVSAWHVSPGSDATTRGAPLVPGLGYDVIDFAAVDYGSGVPTSRIQEVCAADGTTTCGVTPFVSVPNSIFSSSPTYSSTNNVTIVADEGWCGLYPFSWFGGVIGHPTTAAAQGSGCPNVQIAVSGSMTAVAGLAENSLYSYGSDGFSLQGSAGSGSWSTAGAAISGSTVWFAAGDEVVGYDLSTTPPSSIGAYQAGTIVSAPVIDDLGHIYFGVAYGTLTKLMPDGSPMWSLKLGGDSMPGSPAIGVDGVVYLVDSSGALDAVDSSGYLRWTTGPSFAAPFGSPMIDPCNHTLYVTSADESGVEAVVVDSAGLDLAGNAWPVYRHDYFGSGDALWNMTIDCARHL
jgi:hypothetical protein